MPKISVIIPVYNSEKYLEKCLNSILNQTFQDFEIIAVNDGSKDSSQDILDRYCEKYPDKVRCFYQENAGQAAARNNGLRYATGEYISFVDSDDYIDLETYEKTYKFAVDNDLDVVCFGFWEDDGKELRQNDYIRFKNLPNSLTYILSEASPCNKLIKKSLWADNGIRFTEGIIYEDFEVIPRLALYTDKIGYLNERLYYYVIHENSTMRQPSYNAKLQSIFKVMETLRNSFINTKYREELEYLYIAHLLHDAGLRFLPYAEGREDIKRISKIIKTYFPKWRRNKYYKQLDWRFKYESELLYRINTRLLLFLPEFKAFVKKTLRGIKR